MYISTVGSLEKRRDMMQQPTNHGLQEHLWHYISSLETRSTGNNISAAGDYHQWTNPRFVMPSDGDHQDTLRREAEQEYGGSNTDQQLSWGRSFITDNHSTGGCDPFLSSSSSFELMRGLDPHMSYCSDQQWRSLSASSSLGSNPMLHHPLSIQTSQTSSFMDSHKIGGSGSTRGISAGAIVTKRPAAASFHNPEKSQADAKKSRCSTMSRSSSCPILKVRKEKLGDRIAALQKLVAPFGKTDTASVLTEAIGYIQFLHDQVQKLSVPYMKSTGTAVQVSSRQEEVKEEQKADLQGRGLCLVPQSWASFFISSAGFGV